MMHMVVMVHVMMMYAVMVMAHLRVSRSCAKHQA
jgi:hypothetical protein